MHGPMNVIFKDNKTSLGCGRRLLTVDGNVRRLLREVRKGFSFELPHITLFLLLMNVILFI